MTRTDNGDELVETSGEKAYVVRDARHGMRFRTGDDEQTPSEFQSQVRSRFRHCDAAWVEARRIIAGADPDDLRGASRFFEHIYRPRRDQLAAAWSALGAREPALRMS